MTIDKLATQVNKKYGTNVMTLGSAVLEVPRIPTGSLSLDVETGGGIPVGRISTISGQYSDGKTSIVLKIVAEFQKKFPDEDVVWIDAEGAWDSSWARTLGVDADSVHLLHPEYSQQAFDVAEQCISEDVGLLVIDSIAALVPKEEAEATMEDWQIGLAARINNKFIRRTHSSLNDKRGSVVPPTVILINQLRENVGGYGSAETEPGGKGIGFAASVRIKVRKGELYPKPKSNYDTSVVPKAQMVKFYIEKNKTAPPHTRGHMWFYFDTLDAYRTKGSYDRLEEIIRYAKKFDIVLQRGSMFDLVNPITGETQSFKGSTALAQHIRDTEQDRLWIEAAVMEAVLRFNAGEKPQLAEPDIDDEAEGEPSGEEAGSEEASGVGSDTVGEGGSEGQRVPVPTQADKTRNKVTLAKSL
jgi:recombination protein RecA